MRITVLLTFWLCTGLAWAQNSEKASSKDASNIEQRVSVIEVINVTAEKVPAENNSEADADVDAILDEAEALEADATLE